MPSQENNSLSKQAINVLRNASSPSGIRAAAIKIDNYDRVWARDSAVAALAIFATDTEALYPQVLTSLTSLHSSAASTGQIPSNITICESGDTAAVSFGGPAGRTDSSFWWIIASTIYLKRIDDQNFKGIVFEQCHKIFSLAEAWEFNYKHLMYLPLSSNWADEYITNGYSLYDQLLRYWSLLLAGSYFSEESWRNKALAVKIRLKQHYCFEAELDDSLFTAKQREEVRGFELSKQFISSFSPGQIVNRYDCWSIALLLMLHVPSPSSRATLLKAVLEAFDNFGNKGIPAFWPVIDEKDALYEQLTSNHHYQFKNRPGHFHNGGIWPVTNGFLIASLYAHDFLEEASEMMQSLEQNLLVSGEHAFPEYFALTDAKPCGVPGLCFSAAGYLIAKVAQQNLGHLEETFGIDFKKHSDRVNEKAENLASQIVSKLVLQKGQVFVVSISGESGCGKTTLSLALKKQLEAAGSNCLLLHQDDYFKLPPKQNHAKRLTNIAAVGPEEVRLQLLDDHLQQIKRKAAREIIVPVMNWPEDVEEEMRLCIEEADVVLVDGTYTSLLENVDFRVFMSATFQQTKTNRIVRNRETVTEFIEDVLVRESAIIQHHKHMADVIVDEDFSIASSA